MKKQLDFICIGAAKSGTSTLFELIEHHPDIYIPDVKEAPFFNDNEVYKKGWQWYLNTFFKSAKDSVLTGTITPQYMSGNRTNTPEVICDRIYDQNPDIKIVALLRHPITRSFSQYKMHKRQGHHDETFEEATQRLLQSNLEAEKANLTEKNMFLFSSEYGRILSHYFTKFPAENILILYTDELQKTPEKTLQKLFAFLGIDQEYRPENIHRQSHKGGGEAKVKFLTPAFLRSMPAVEFLWKKLVPMRLRKKIFMKITRWNIKPDDSRLDPNSSTYHNLVTYFEPDIRTLEKLTSGNVPWADWD